MLRRDGVKKIVNISSNAADQPIPTLSVYAMTKAAVTAEQAGSVAAYCDSAALGATTTDDTRTRGARR